MILFTDSVSYCDDPGFGTKYVITGSGLQSAILPGRYGGYSLFAFNTGFGSWAAKRSFTSGGLTFRAHMSFRTNTSGGALFPNSIFGGFATIGTQLLSWKINSTGTISFYTGGSGTNSNPGSFIMRSVATFPFGEWHTIEIEATFGLRGKLSLYVDDVLDSTDLNVAWVTTQTPTIFGHYWESFGLQGIEWCDLVVSDDQGMFNNLQLGPCQVVCDFPLSDATSPQWARNMGASDASCVNEQNGAANGAPNFNYNYIDGTVDLSIDLFNVSTPACFGRNLAVAANVCGMNGTMLILCRPLPSSLAVNDVGGSFSPGPTYVTVQRIQETSFLSGTYWTDREIGQAWWGVQALGGPRVTQFFLEKVTSLRPVPYDCGGGGSYVV